MSDKTVSLKVLHGQVSDKKVVAVVLDLLVGSPAVVWCEPAPGRKRVPDFVGLWTGKQTGLPKLLASTSIDEARLFWDTGWVHVLAGQDCVRWAAFHEGEEPAWLSPLLPSLKKREDSWDSLRWMQDNVLLMHDRDWKRYCLGEWKDRPDNLRVIEYYRGTNLVGWRLEAKS